MTELNHALKCIKCGKEYPGEGIRYNCDCGALLDVIYDYDKIREKVSIPSLRKRPIGVWRYRELMPISDMNKIITLNEGGTPLYKCDRLAKEIGIKELFVKFEGANPTGSFKDRGMTVGVSKAVELGVQTVLCASTGNTSASLAAYASKVGIRCIVLLPTGKIALGKLAQAMFHGALALEISDNFDRAMDLVMQLAKAGKAYLLNSINPYRPEGQKTIGHEIADQLQFDTPDGVFVPVGNAANIWSIYKGFKEFNALGLTDGIPKMMGIQAEGAKPVVQAFRENSEEVKPEKNPETFATAIRIGNPINGPKALKAIRESKGYAESVTDNEIRQAQLDLARKEGIGVEPASAASIAGLKKLSMMGKIDPEERFVCVCTGHLLKDPDVAIKASKKPVQVKADYESLLKYFEE